MARTKTMILQNNEGELFFRGDHPDKRTGPQWVKAMNRKYPELEWGMRVREKKEKRKKEERKQNRKK